MFTKTLITALATAAAALAVPFNATEASQLVARDQGRGTIYQQFGVAGSCGNVHGDGDYIVALPHSYMQHQYKSHWCGATVKIINHGSGDGNVRGNGREITAIVADSCDGCGPSDIDLSVGAWAGITDNSGWSWFNAEW